MSLFQIGVSVESRTVVAQEFFALFKADFALLHALGDPDFELANEFLRIVLYVVEHFFHCFAIDDLVDVVLPVFH